MHDDYQQLFATLVREHVHHLMQCCARKEQPEPLRLCLLGIAGSGKTRAIQTLLQEVQRALASAKLDVDIYRPREFVYVLVRPQGLQLSNMRCNPLRCAD